MLAICSCFAMSTARECSNPVGWRIVFPDARPFQNAGAGRSNPTTSLPGVRVGTAELDDVVVVLPPPPPPPQAARVATSPATASRGKKRFTDALLFGNAESGDSTTRARRP